MTGFFCVKKPAKIHKLTWSIHAVFQVIVHAGTERKENKYEKIKACLDSKV